MDAQCAVLVHDTDDSCDLSFDALLDDPEDARKDGIEEDGFSEGPSMLTVADDEVYKMPISLEENPPQNPKIEISTNNNQMVPEKEVSSSGTEIVPKDNVVGGFHIPNCWHDSHEYQTLQLMKEHISANMWTESETSSFAEAGIKWDSTVPSFSEDRIHIELAAFTTLNFGSNPYHDLAANAHEDSICATSEVCERLTNIELVEFSQLDLASDSRDLVKEASPLGTDHVPQRSKLCNQGEKEPFQAIPNTVPQDCKICDQDEGKPLRSSRSSATSEALTHDDNVQCNQKQSIPSEATGPQSILRAPRDGSPSPKRGRSSSCKRVRFDENTETKAKRGPDESQKLAFKRMLIQRRGKRVIQKMKEREERLNLSDSFEEISTSLDSFSDESDSESSSSYSENMTHSPKKEKQFQISNNPKDDPDEEFSENNVHYAKSRVSRTIPVLVKGPDFPVKRVPEKMNFDVKDVSADTNALDVRPSQVPTPLPFSGKIDVYVEEISDLSELTGEYDFADYRSESESYSYGGHDIISEDTSLEELRARFSKPVPQQRTITNHIVRHNSLPEASSIQTEAMELKTLSNRTQTETQPSYRRPARSSSLPISKTIPSLREDIDVLQFLPSASVFGSAFQKLLDTDKSLHTSI